MHSRHCRATWQIILSQTSDLSKTILRHSKGQKKLPLYSQGQTLHCTQCSLVFVNKNSSLRGRIGAPVQEEGGFKPLSLHCKLIRLRELWLVPVEFAPKTKGSFGGWDGISSWMVLWEERVKCVPVPILMTQSLSYQITHKPKVLYTF